MIRGYTHRGTYARVLARLIFHDHDCVQVQLLAQFGNDAPSVSVTVVSFTVTDFVRDFQHTLLRTFPSSEGAPRVEMESVSLGAEEIGEGLRRWEAETSNWGLPLPRHEPSETSPTQWERLLKDPDDE